MLALFEIYFLYCSFNEGRMQGYYISYYNNSRISDAMILSFEENIFYTTDNTFFIFRCAFLYDGHWCIKFAILPKYFHDGFQSDRSRHFQWLDEDFTDFDFAAFALDADGPGRNVATGDFVHELAVDPKFDGAPGTFRLQRVPLAHRLFVGGLRG